MLLEFILNVLGISLGIIIGVGGLWMIISNPMVMKNYLKKVTKMSLDMYKEIDADLISYYEGK